MHALTDCRTDTQPQEDCKVATWAVFRYSVGSDKKERTIEEQRQSFGFGVTKTGRLALARANW